MRKYAGLLRSDPRYFQIISQATLFTLLTVWSDFSPGFLVYLLTLASTCLSQIFLFRLFGIPSRDLRSAIITAFTISLFMKTSLLWIFPLAGFLAMASKFTLRMNDKHLFNPGNFAIVLCLLVFPDYVWISPGQWGTAIWLVFAVLCLGSMVVARARRADMTLFFLGSWAALIVGRAFWLGDPAAIPMHALESGTLLIFAFFMISDPKSTPDHWVGRLIFAATTALLAFVLQYPLQVREGLLYALFFVSLWTPLIDDLFKHERYQWRTA